MSSSVEARRRRARPRPRRRPTAKPSSALASAASSPVPGREGDAREGEVAIVIGEAEPHAVAADELPAMAQGRDVAGEVRRRARREGAHGNLAMRIALRNWHGSGTISTSGIFGICARPRKPRGRCRARRCRSGPARRTRSRPSRGARAGGAAAKVTRPVVGSQLTAKPTRLLDAVDRDPHRAADRLGDRPRDRARRPSRRF